MPACLGVPFQSLPDTPEDSVDPPAVEFDASFSQCQPVRLQPVRSSGGAEGPRRRSSTIYLGARGGRPRP